MPPGDIARLEAVYSMRIETRKPLALLRGWNRLEGRPRTTDFERSLRAEVRDPLWFLTRQWQFGEFQGEDAASPIDVALGIRVGRAVFAPHRRRTGALRSGGADRNARRTRAGAVRPDAAHAGLAVSRAPAHVARDRGISCRSSSATGRLQLRMCQGCRTPTPIALFAAGAAFLFNTETLAREHSRRDISRRWPRR